MVDMQTIALDPIVFNDRRAEFLLPDDYYDSASMVLSNLGMFAPDIAIDNQKNLFYPLTCGVAGVISKFTLLSGADEIEMLDHVSQWATIKALNNPDTELEDVHHNTLRSGWNFIMGRTPQMDIDADYDMNNKPSLFSCQNTDYSSMTYNDNMTGVSAQGSQSRISNKQFPPGSSGSLKVSMISGFLQATPILPMIRNLRLVIEYDTNISHYFNRQVTELPMIPAMIYPTFPMLIVKKFVNPPVMPAVIQIPYTTVKCADGFFVPAIVVPTEGEGIISRNTYQSYDFMGKVLKRLTVYNAPIGMDTTPDYGDDADTYMLNTFKSIGQPNEVINFIINGEKYLPDNGIDSPALKLQYLLSAHGNTSIPLLCAVYGLQSPTSVIFGNTEDIIGNLSLTAIKVDTLISTAIQVEYSRQAVIASDPPQEGVNYQQALNILLFGEIAQLMTINADRSITIES